MSCKAIEPLLHGYLDNELDFSSVVKVEEHLEQCLACRNSLQALKTLSAGIRQSASYFEPNAGFQQRLQTALANEAPKAKTEKKWLTGFKPVFLSSLASGALAFGLTALVYLPGQNQQLSETIVANHIRSLQAEHLTDVASSDQHTVKPWFNGKLTFSPPVKDFTEQGFPLVGGRLDLLDNQPVTALVYRRRQHFINVFIRPSQYKTDTDTTMQSTNGYQIFNFAGKGMEYWVISDLNEKELNSLVELLQNPA